MIWIWLWGIACVVTVAFTFWEAQSHFGFWDRVGSPFIRSVGGVFFVSVAAAILSMFATLFVDERTETRTYELTTLQDGTSAGGSFFLGSGTLDNKMQYAYYLREDNGSYRLETTTADDARVRFDAGVPRTEEEWHCVPDGGLWTSPLLRGLCSFHSATFYIPEGSIKTTYTLDAQ